MNLVSSNSSRVLNEGNTEKTEEFETTTNSLSNLDYKAVIEEDLNNYPPPTIRASYVELGNVQELLSEIPGDTVILPVDKYGLHKGQDVPSKALRFDCNASYPVEWIYAGFGVRKLMNFEKL